MVLPHRVGNFFTSAISVYSLGVASARISSSQIIVKVVILEKVFFYEVHKLYLKE